MSDLGEEGRIASPESDAGLAEVENDRAGFQRLETTHKEIETSNLRSNDCKREIELLEKKIASMEKRMERYESIIREYALDK